ncbi:hypothetical protein N7456_006607 [Penicillium angulare]|uniref:Nucleoside phosphorylase domain-containing protein n=1 Tax=Penicillium angulare TaxID=116970 RepID=A0A9W9FI50_9EURO|nr:hypothetical protein N7456_006607 [Penicillium angulare]
MTLDDSSPAPASDDAPTSWETRVGSGMPLHDIMEQWSKYEVEGMDNGTWIEPDESLDGRDEYSSGDVEGFNMGPAEEIDADEALSTTMPALEKYREFIVENPAYDWFLNDIRKHCHLAPSIPDALPSQTSFSRREPIDLYKMTYSMDWDLVSFLNEQQYNEEAHRALPLVITLTGSREAAQAFTCSQYLHQTWPSSAGELLKLLQSVLQKGKAAGDLPDGTKLAAWLHSSDTSMEQNLQIETIGSAYSVTEVGELLSWLGSALRTSPYLDQIAYCRPRVSRFQTIVHNHENSKHQYAAEITAEISCTIEKKKAPSGINGDCWHGLFRNCVVVEGYPIPRRTEDDAANGLEIPLGMMASLAQAKYVNTFLGTPILKGFSSMLVPTGVHDNAISWHLVHNKNGDRISYLDSTVTPAKGLVAGRLSQTRHILGWCSDARYLAGTKDAKYDVAGSRLPKPRDNGIYSQTFITSGQLITGGSPFLVGYKDTPFHVSRAGYIRKLKWIIQKSVVLWDEETKRGWLLNGASALLHLVRASIVHDSTGPLSSECLFQWDQLEEGPSGSAHIPGSAIALLLNRNNRALAIYGSKDEDIKFEDRVEHFLSILEQIFDYEVYAVGPDGDGYTSKSIPRAHFEGWDFHDLATESDPLYPRLAKIASKGKAWIDFTRSIHAINLLGRGFGDILEPLNSSCSHWASLPKDQYYLAAGIADLQKIVEYTGDLKANPIRLSEDLVWHNPERVFDFCGCVDATTNHADVVQVILPAALSESENQYNSSIDLYHTGAVVFGYSRDFQWRWGDSGDPERDDIHTDEQDHLSPNYDLAPDNSNTSSIGSKSDLAPLSSIEAPSTEDTNLTSCAEEECTQPKPLARSYTHWNLASLRAEDYAVGIVCALSLELLAVRALFDQTHPTIELSAADSNHYALGSMGRHRVVAACLPDGEYGTNSAADVASNLRRSFPSVKFCLLVGIGGGVPSPTNDIRLGDVVVSKPIGMNPGVIQYDMGKAVRNGVFEQNGVLHAPPRMIMTALSNLKSDPHLSENPLQEYIDEIAACRKEYRYPGPNKDRLFSSRFVHNSKHATCDTCSDAHVVLRHTRSGQHPRIHYGLIASGNSVIKDAALRDKWRKESNVLCFEMEAAGIMNTLPCLVIRGICDYSDSHKNKAFQEYAAATAASYAKLLLSYIKDTNEMDGMALRSIKDDQSLLGAFRRALAFLPMRGA